MNEPVRFTPLPCRNGMRLEIATLNAARSLNSLSLEIIQALAAWFDAYEHDPDVAALVLRGDGEKAFSAGGDLRSLYHAMGQGQDTPETLSPAHRLFAEEYRLDYRLYRSSKPLLCWVHGHVIGGGLGLMRAASHRIGAPNARLSMPEIAIGLYPDAGASRWLHQLPGQLGVFLGLTGAPLNARDALDLGLLQAVLDPQDMDRVYAQLAEQLWLRADQPAAARVNAELLTASWQGHGMAAADLPHPNVRAHAAAIDLACSASGLQAMVEAIQTLGKEAGEGWMQSAAQALHYGAPGSMRLVLAMRDACRDASLAELFRLEYNAAVACCDSGMLKEGIRALLIDRDRQPSWTPADLSQASSSWAQQLLAQAAPVPEDHPLRDLA